MKQKELKMLDILLNSLKKMKTLLEPSQSIHNAECVRVRQRDRDKFD